MSLHYSDSVGGLTVESWFQGGSLTVVVSGNYIRRRDAWTWMSQCSSMFYHP